MMKADGGLNLVRSAQEAIMNGIKDLESSGRLAIRRKADLADGEIYLTACTQP